MKKCFTINPMRKKEEFDSYLELLKNNVYQAIEIFYPYNQSHEQFIQYTNSVKKIKDTLPNIEMVLHLPHGLYNGLCLEEHLKAKSLEIMFQAASYAAMFNIKKLTLHLGHIDQNVDRKVYIEEIIPRLELLCDYASIFDQKVMIENMPFDCELGYSPEEILEIIKRTNHPNIKFIFDTGHAHVSRYEDTEYLYLLKDYLYHIHYSDNDGTGDQHRPIGTGNIDFNKHFKALKDIEYKELHCMEVIYHSATDLSEYSKDFKKYEDIIEK